MHLLRSGEWWLPAQLLLAGLRYTRIELKLKITQNISSGSVLADPSSHLHWWNGSHVPSAERLSFHAGQEVLKTSPATHTHTQLIDLWGGMRLDEWTCVFASMFKAAPHESLNPTPQSRDLLYNEPRCSWAGLIWLVVSYCTHRCVFVWTAGLFASAFTVVSVLVLSLWWWILSGFSAK